MKVAVSIPDDIFSEGEALAQKLSLSRSKLYARAIEEFAAKHDPDSITEAMNAALDAIGGDDDMLPFVREASRRVFAKTEW